MTEDNNKRKTNGRSYAWEKSREHLPRGSIKIYTNQKQEDMLMLSKVELNILSNE